MRGVKESSLQGEEEEDLQGEEEANLRQDLARTRGRMRQVEEECNDVISQLDEIQGERCELQAQLSTVVAESLGSARHQCNDWKPTWLKPVIPRR